MEDNSQGLIPQPPSEVYLTFCGAVNQDSVARIFQSFSVAVNTKVKEIHLLFQSTGGFVSDGVCLYHYFKALTCNLTVYNVGSVQSVAAIAYLGAKTRKTSARATFMIHRTMASPQAAKAKALKAFANSAVLDDRRTEAILRDHITLSPERWADLDHNDLTFSGEDAVKIGIATEIGEFAPPLGTPIYNI